jgi:tRNA(Ile)-lysidine synthetase-like protein
LLPVVRGDLLLAAVSGGPDSSALLLLLQRFAPVVGYSLRAARFDHQLQSSAERTAEAETVCRLCAMLDIPLSEGAAPVRALRARHRRSIEEEARVQRYSFLREAALSAGARAVATGHTADDQAETVLMHILRGSGLRGLTGMGTASPWPVGDGPRLLRPMLGLTHQDAEYYCEARDFRPHHDLSNDSRSSSRNRVRHELLPLLRTFNPRVETSLSRLSAVATELQEFIAGEALRGGSVGEPPALNDAGVPLLHLRSMPAAVRTEWLFAAYARAHGSREALSARHLNALESLIRAGGEHSLDLPGGIAACTIGGLLSIERQRPPNPAQGAEFEETELNVPGVTHAGPWLFTAEIAHCGANVKRTTAGLILPLAGAPPRLTVRSWRAGDRMRPAGMGGSKTLQNLFVDARVPRSRRGQIPLVCADGEIVWVVGLRYAELPPHGGRVLRLCARRLDASET